jgi:hypothetical protein
VRFSGRAFRDPGEIAVGGGFACAGVFSLWSHAPSFARARPCFTIEEITHVVHRTSGAGQDAPSPRNDSGHADARAEKGEQRRDGGAAGPPMTPRVAAAACSGRYRTLVELLDRALDDAERAGLEDPLPSLLELAGATVEEAGTLARTLRDAFPTNEEMIWRWLLEAHPRGLDGLTTPVEAMSEGRTGDVIAEITRLEHGAFT